MIKVYEISMTTDRRYDVHGNAVMDWFTSMGVEFALSGDDGYLAPNECDMFCDSAKSRMHFFFANPHLACLFKMRFG